MKAKFISFEGIEGSGKTTQSKLLYEHLKKSGIDAVWTREPGGTIQGENIRDFLLDNTLSSTTELLLIMAARFEHVKQVILPALANNKWVICDRFVDSSVCYQATNNDCEMQLVLDLHKKIFGELFPDVTFFIDVPVECGLARVRQRGALDKYEKMDEGVHDQIYQCYHKLASLFSQRIKIISGTSSTNIVHKKLVSELNLLAKSK